MCEYFSIHFSVFVSRAAVGMATREKIKKKKGKAPGPAPKSSVAPAATTAESGSVISVREAQDGDRADTVQVRVPRFYF